MNVFQFKNTYKGLFYSGCVSDEINFVYDCGTAKNSKTLLNEISSLESICPVKRLDFAVISHIDADYFNGLPALCKKFEIQTIYLPYLGENRELIRLMLVSSVFKRACANDEDFEEKSSLYSFMCGLYGIESRIKNSYCPTAIKKIRFLGQDNSDNAKTCEGSNSVIYKYNNTEDYALWTFIMINQSPNAESYMDLDRRFKEAYSDLYTADGEFKSDLFERKLISLARDADGIKKLNVRLNMILGDNGPNPWLSSNILIHYPKKPNKNIHISEYKTLHGGLLQTPLRRIGGAITVLLGNIQVNKKLEEQIFGCGNYSINSGVLQIPNYLAAENDLGIIGLARPFQTFVMTAASGTQSSMENMAVLRRLMYPNRTIHLATQNTGVTYFVE